MVPLDVRLITYDCTASDDFLKICHYDTPIVSSTPFWTSRIVYARNLHLCAAISARNVVS